MKLNAISLCLLLGSGMALAQFPPQIKNVVIIFQENRTPDNLFHSLAPACLLPPGAAGVDACTPVVTGSCYDISPCGLSNESGTVVPVPLKGRLLAGSVDPDHTHTGFENMCDPDPSTLKCRMDGAWQTAKPHNASYAYVENPKVMNYDGSPGHLLDPYLTLAKSYGWANNMFQTNQGPSYPAHQYIFSGTSAPTRADDEKSTFISENFNSATIGKEAGCLAPKGTTNMLISPALETPPPDCTVWDNGSVKECEARNEALNYPGDPVGSFCYPHQNMADVLNPLSISWKYYSPSPGSIWTAPDSFRSICVPQFVNPNADPDSKLECTGKQWQENVDMLHHGADILSDIDNCSLRHVSWVIPDGAWSDHAGIHDKYGPSWVAAIVNAIGTRKKCGAGTEDEGQTLWDDTAIIITWDDWGGWSDHVSAHYLSQMPCRSLDCQGDYQHGFRVPLLVVSAWTPAGYINNDIHNFGSILRMIEGIYHIHEGQLGFADLRSASDLSEFFTLTAPRGYTPIPAVKDAKFFLDYNEAPIDPDDD